MNITFLIGNGFDLNLGLKTDYKSFYKYYIQQEPNDELSKSIKKNYELWSDLEEGLGNYLKNISTEMEIEDFLDSKEKLEKHLADYLRMQSNKFKIIDENKLVNGFAEKVSKFYEYFSPKDAQHYSKIANKVNKFEFQFIDFNYTKTLDSIIKLTNKMRSPFSSHFALNIQRTDTLNTPLHIHGDIGNSIILGVNDILQIKNPKLRSNETIANYLLKPNLNESSGNLNIQKAQTIIDKSIYICIYGMSIGDTDNMWWKSIIKWLLEDKDRRVVLFIKDDTLVSQSATAVIRKSTNKKRWFINKQSKALDEKYKAIESQIIVIANSDIFNLSGYSVERKNIFEIIQSQEENKLTTNTAK